MPAAATPRAFRSARRPVATSRRWLRTGPAPSRCTVKSRLSWLTRRRRVRVRMRIPSLRSTSPTSSLASSSSPGSNRSAASTIVTALPNLANAWGQFHADRAAAGDGERGRCLLGLQSLTICPVGGTGQPLDRRNRRPGPGGEYQAARRAELPPVNDDGAPAGHSGVTTDKLAPFTGELLNGGRVVPVVGGLLPDPPGDNRPVRLNGGVSGQLAYPSRLGEGVRRPDDHLAGHASPVRAFPADQG